MATIPYANVIDHQILPVDSKDIVTAVRLVIAGSLAGAEPWNRVTRQLNEPGDPEPENLNHMWLPITYRHEAAEHAVYGCERAMALPEGLNPFLEPMDVPGDPASGDFTNVEAMNDGDPETYAVIADLGSGGGVVSYSAAKCYGFRLTYLLNLGAGARTTFPGAGTPAEVQLQNISSYSSTYPAYNLLARWAIPETPEYEWRDLYAVMSFDARSQPENRDAVPTESSVLTFWVLGQPVSGQLWVRNFYPLVLDVEQLAEIASAQVRLPAQEPRRVTVEGFVPPDQEHTITGWPGGDFTGRVAQHQHDLGKTVIDFEQAASPLGLPADLVEAERARRSSNRSDIATAAYPLLMGQRQ